MLILEEVRRRLRDFKCLRRLTQWIALGTACFSIFHTDAVGGKVSVGPSVCEDVGAVLDDLNSRLSLGF